jgi:Tol biopolymer transport system component
VRPGAFFSNQSPSRIVLIAADGRSHPITDSTTFYQSPRWSSDGSQLFFVSNRHGPRDIYALAVRPDGRSRGQPERITTGLGVHSFSLDAANTHLAYAVYNERANLWSLPIPRAGPVSIDGAVQLTSGSQVIEVMRTTPGSRWVYYDSDLNGSADVYRIPVLGGEPQRLTTDPGDEYAATGSPDDSEIAYHSFRTGSRDIFVQKIGGVAEQLTNTADQECCPVWSPDGNALGYTEFGLVGRLHVTRRDAGGRWSAPVQRLPRGFLHTWSPDGKTIAVASGQTIRGSLQVERLELIAPDAGEPRTLYSVTDTITDPIVEDPHWAPDSKGLYFKSHDQTGQASIWYVPVSGGRPRMLVRFTDPARPSFRPNLASDGKRFYFTINDRQSDVWVAEVSRRR